LSLATAALTKRPALAVITVRQGGDGVAYAGKLLERALAVITKQRPRIIALTPGTRTRPTIAEQGRFVGRIALAQLHSSEGWWLFNHVGIARAQNLIPPAIRRPYAVLLCGIEAWDPELSANRRKALRNASARIAISRYTADRVSTAHPDIGPILVCPLALLSKESTNGDVDRTLLESIRKPSVLIVGRMSRSERYKGHDELLECWSEVLRRVPTAQLVIVGTGDDAHRLRAKAKALGVSENVLFTGFVSDGTLVALRQLVAAFALPSRGEGFGLVYLEAMRAGLPCLGGTEDAARDVIVDGETGILVKPSSRGALSDALVRLLTDPEMRSAFGIAGRKRFEQEFTFEHYCARLRVLLETTFA
jgi:phosphatidylinositol alpha-1,6-mannosyltransferase